MKKAGKIIIYILLALFALIFVVAAFIPKNFEVKESVMIPASVESVFELTNNYDHMLKWNPWTEMDPESKNTITGNAITPGYTWSWEGEKVGIGYLAVTEVIPNQKVTSKLVFTSPNESEMIDIRTFEQIDGTTQVSWMMKDEMSYPFERLVSLMIKPMLQQNLSNGLENLKTYAKKVQQMKPVAITIGIEGMTCSGCENTIISELSKLPGVTSVKASHVEKTAVINVDSTQFNYNDYKNSIENVGYTALGIK